MTVSLVQGTKEWLDARVGLITGSMVGAVLGCSPFTSRKAALKRMVEETLGNRDFYENEAMRWGRDHEEEAAKLYKALYAGKSEVKETGFYSKGDLGASPDREVGAMGLLEIKCPYGLRDELVPEFQSIETQKHYWHQIQMQLHVTGREWCDFLQWTPHDHKLERVTKDDNWLTDNAEAFAQFMEEYHQLLDQLKEGGASARLAQSSGFEAAVANYRKQLQAFELAKANLDTAKDALTELCKAQALDIVENDECKVQLITREGSVQWKSVAKALADDEKLKELSEQYKGKSSEYYKIDLKETP